MRKKALFIFGMIFLFSIIVISLTHTVKAADVSYCCEKTVDGALCQNAPLTSCDTSNGLSAQPTSCNQTSYCQLGTCVDSNQGMCLPNTPKQECETNGGYWTTDSPDTIPQCSYGCCLYGDQSALVTQARCTTLGSMTGQKVNYRSDITDELTCLASANSDAKGACVYEESSGTKSCKLTTKSECNNLGFSSSYNNVTFNEGYLCSAQFLGTICGPSKKTTCDPASSEVYFEDTCGNLANVYDASKINDEQYWTKIVKPSDSCGTDSANGNADSASCGNCNYLAGSMCKPYVRGENQKPTFGDNVCADLGCKTGTLAQDFYKEYGRYPYHGESWCATSNKEGVKGFNVGTESYTLSCYDGEVMQEGCSIGNNRNLICKSDVSNGVSSAACVTNLWRDCYNQTTEATCTDAQQRDCKWVVGEAILKDANGNPLTKDANGNTISASCVPKYPPTSNFWDGSQDTTAAQCAVGNSISVVQYDVPWIKLKSGIPIIDWALAPKAGSISAHDDNTFAQRLYRMTNWKDKNQNYSALDASGQAYTQWLQPKNNVCASLGDCSAGLNYQGQTSDTIPANLTLYKFFRKVKDAINSVNNGTFNG